ncbi:oxysterol binding protein 1 [Patellaria atrata CBS 101060]|uniref:Oxysterol binding protein 1 n=1 Tax=Patellaria atrata CBS 101060 TaxID=1346257 RepID=A0A9P4VW22_9PEZI|nr:oxysterol binding protein 1 [Patellaria atrata CBS 101060]
MEHKRSKSSQVKSLLNRVSSRQDVTDIPDSVSNTSLTSSTSQPTSISTQPPSLHQRPATRHRPHLSTTMSNNPTQDSLIPPSPSRSQHVPLSPTVKPASIEQSVKLFRIFEALRNGDTTAISKALREEYGINGGDKGIPSSPTSISGSSRLEGTSILHLAIQCAELPVIEYVLSNASSTDHGIDINGRDKDGNTPLHIAAQLGRTAVVRMLLDHKDVNDSMTNYQGQTALDLARTPEIFQQLQLARSLYIETNVKNIQALVQAGDYPGIERLLKDPHIQSTVDVNSGELATDPATTENGGTLLHEAARKRDIKLIQILLLNGADPFRRDRKGKLPQDVTKDDRTRAILKRSPAAAAAQRVIQEKTILGGNAPQAAAGPSESPAGSKEGREMKGYLKKWTNYTSGYKLRWFVLEDGVLSYYKHQDDAGSACRGAINMRIAKLHMDPQDKLRFEIQGKSSVKYHLKANHQVEAKRWYWALNNSIQWTKDEAKEEEKRQNRETEALRQAKIDQLDKRGGTDGESIASSKVPGKTSILSTALGVPGTSGSRAPGSTVGDDDLAYSTYAESSMAGADISKIVSHANTALIEGDMDDDEEYGDDGSSHEAQPVNKDAFNITAQSAKFQLDILGQISAGLHAERSANPRMTLSDPVAFKALSSYESAVGNLKGLVGDLLRISRDRDAYWQYRLDREANVRRLWEESMAKVAKEQEELESRMGEAEEKRRRTKRALKDALEGLTTVQSSPGSDAEGDQLRDLQVAVKNLEVGEDEQLSKGSVSLTVPRRSTIAELANLSDLDSDSDDEDEEFFDAVGAGEVEVVALATMSPPLESAELVPPLDGMMDNKTKEIATSFRGYEDPVRTRLKMDADDRPKISLWGILKSMIGKDMTKMTLPVSFNEPTSLLQRVAEDMEYTDLLDTAADRMDSTERMVYVAAFAASEYASTIGRVAKPFNPLLGETYEYARPDKGYRFFIEQVSHHPPIGAAYAESTKWDYWGESAVKSKFYGKSFDINPLGTWFLRLRPASGGEELYTWKKVTSSVVGIITGNPTVDNYGPMEIKNWTTGEVCMLDFKARGWKASSAYQVSGKVLDSDGKTRWSIGGRWNDKIYARHTPGYEGSVTPPAGGSKSIEAGSSQAFLVWECHKRPTGIPFNLTPFVLTLNALPDNLRPVIAPTDTRLRPDQRAMEDGEYDLAATEKNRVEEKQRATRRLREAKGEEFVPRWFTKGTCEVTGEEYWVFNHEYWKIRDEVAAGEERWEGLEDIF